MYVALVIALLALIVLTAFNAKVRSGVIWFSKKALAIFLTALTAIVIGILVFLVALVSFFGYTIFGILALILWLLKKFFELVAPLSLKAYLFFVYKGHEVIIWLGNTLKWHAKMFWKRSRS